MRIRGTLGVALAASVLAAACGATTKTAPTTLRRQECTNPDAQLRAVLEPLEAQRAAGCAPSKTAASCISLELELERLAVVCPNHAPTLVANAVVAYDQHQAARAQQLLDEALSGPAGNPVAAELRARIAIEDGNLTFAHRLLDDQIKLAPDHAGLREVLGGALYLSGHLPEARRELTAAQALGAPKWRVAYHLGLVEEASGRFDDAKRRYAEALDGRPGYGPAESRLRALRLKDGPAQ